MPAIEILAHRGWWDKPAQRNTSEALQRAFDAGLGVETDIRDCSGEIVVSHDPPINGALLFRKMLEAYAKASHPGYLALNVKADGLQEAVGSLLREFEISKYFMFDMSVPDALHWHKAGMPAFTRHSELERQPVLYDRATGVWLDAFTSDWYSSEIIVKHLEAEKMVAVISPEIHGREPAGVWEMLLKIAGRTQPGGCTTNGTMNGLFLCTDRVAEARRFFHGQN